MDQRLPGGHGATTVRACVHPTVSLWALSAFAPFSGAWRAGRRWRPN